MLAILYNFRAVSFPVILFYHSILDYIWNYQLLFNRQGRPMHMNINRHSSKILDEKQVSNPQINLYNRHFYLRAAEHNLRLEQHETQIKQLANKPKISVSSYNILCQQLEDKLMKSFTKHRKGQVGDGKNYDTKYNSRDGREGKKELDDILIDFQTLQSIVHDNFMFSTSSESDIEHFLSQIWLALGDYNIKSEIKASLLYSSLRIFMDPYNLTQQEYLQMLNHIEQFKKAPENRQKFLKEYPELRQQTLTVQMIIKLWKKIRYQNPAFSKTIQKQKSIEKCSQHPFKPLINKKSEYLAQKSLKKYISNNQSALNKTLDPNRKQKKDQNQLSRYLDNSECYERENNNAYFSKPTYHDILFQRKLQKDEVHARVPKEDSFEMSQVSRTARPEQIKEIVKNLYVVKQKKQDTNFAERDEENELKNCTFSPKINHNYYSSRRSISPAIKGYEKQVSRLQKGRQQKQKKKLAYQNLGRVKNFNRNYSKSPNRSIAPSFIDRQAPKLILEINIDGDRVEKLALKGNQNPHLVSKKFVIMHGLGQQMIEVLEELVKQQLENL